MREPWSTMTDTLNKGLDSKIAIGMTLGVKVGILAALLIIGVFAAYFFMFSPESEALSLSIPGITTNNTTNHTIKNKLGNYRAL